MALKVSLTTLFIGLGAFSLAQEVRFGHYQDTVANSVFTSLPALTSCSVLNDETPQLVVETMYELDEQGERRAETSPRKSTYTFDRDGYLVEADNQNLGLFFGSFAYASGTSYGSDSAYLIYDDEHRLETFVAHRQGVVGAEVSLNYEEDRITADVFAFDEEGEVSENDPPLRYIIASNAPNTFDVKVYSVEGEVWSDYSFTLDEQDRLVERVTTFVDRPGSRTKTWTYDEQGSVVDVVDVYRTADGEVEDAGNNDYRCEVMERGERGNPARVIYSTLEPYFDEARATPVYEITYQILYHEPSQSSDPATAIVTEPLRDDIDWSYLYQPEVLAQIERSSYYPLRYKSESPQRVERIDDLETVYLHFGEAGNNFHDNISCPSLEALQAYVALYTEYDVLGEEWSDYENGDNRSNFYRIMEEELGCVQDFPGGYLRDVRRAGEQNFWIAVREAHSQFRVDTEINDETFETEAFVFYQPGEIYYSFVPPEAVLYAVEQIKRGEANRQPLSAKLSEGAE